MINRKRMPAALLLMALLASPSAALALINPNFTPVHLVNESEDILVATLKGKTIEDKLELEVSTTLKGKAPAALTIDLSAGPKDEADSARAQLRKSADRPVLLFADGGAQKAFLHVNGMWLRLSGAKGAWKFDAIDEKLPATWEGGTDMLIRCVQYILADPDSATVPSEAGTNWRAIRKIGSVGGRARDIAVVDLAGTYCLFVAGDAGDRLLRPGKDSSFKDITDKVKLASKSRLAAWGNFAGDGRMSLASYDGKTLTIWTQAADGTFAPTKPGGTFDLPDGCVGLATIAVASARTPGLLLSPVSGPPVLLKPTAPNSFQAVKLPAPAAAPKDYGSAQPCLVADFTGDSLIDIIQPFEKGGLIYRANKEGTFDVPKPSAVCSTAGGGKATLADFDGDGLPDILMAGAEGVHIFQNRGHGAFEDTLHTCGELSYKNQPNATWCGMCDLNNDSRPGLFITYAAKPMMLYFNRGFRSFGQLPGRDIGLDDIPTFGQGQQMALFADLDGSGAQNLFVVTNNGHIWCAFKSMDNDNAAMCIQAGLPIASPSPVNVSAWKEKRCLGAAVIQAGTAPAFFGIDTAGSYTLKWRFPGGREMAKAVTVSDRPVNVVLGSGQ